MNKEDILLKSKNDNRKGDELQVKNRQNAEMFGGTVVIAVLLILAIIGPNFIRGEIQIGSATVLIEDFINILLDLGLGSEFAAKFYYERKWWQLVLALFFLSAMIFYYIRYQL